MFYNRPQYPQQIRSPYSRQSGYSRFNRYSQQPEMELNAHYNQTQQWAWETSAQTACPLTDVLELDEQFVLQIALPGVVLDDVELKVEENVLTVIAKRIPNMFEERAQMLRKELPVGYFVRHFEFETPIFQDHIEARMDRGILFVSLPKVEQAVRIPVSAGSIESHIPGLKTRVGEGKRSSREVSVK